MLQINTAQQFENRFSAHAGIKIVTELFKSFKVLLVIEQLIFFKRGHARIDDNVALEIEHSLDIPQSHVQQQADTGRQ